MSENWITDQRLDAGGTSSGCWSAEAGCDSPEGPVAALAANHLRGPIDLFSHVLDHLPSPVLSFKHTTSALQPRFPPLDRVGAVRDQALAELLIAVDRDLGQRLSRRDATAAEPDERPDGHGERQGRRLAQPVYYGGPRGSWRFATVEPGGGADRPDDVEVAEVGIDHVDHVDVVEHLDTVRLS